MAKNKRYPLEEIEIKEEYSPYKKYEEIHGGIKVLLNIPHRYNIELRCYDIIPGISIIIDDSELMDKYNNHDEIISYEHPEENLLINFILEGQCQLEVSPDKYMFIRNNDINCYIKEFNPNSFSYLGKTKVFHLIINKKQFKESLTSYNAEYYEIIKTLFNKVKSGQNILFKSPENVIKIMNEIFEFKSTKPLTDRIFIQIKTMELLLSLYEYDFVDEKTEQRTYTDAQIRVVRTIKNQLSRNIASYVSLDSLSLNYGINLTTLKNCFKDMYGKPLYTWYKEYKFYRARELIKNTDYPISKIAHMIGYKSSSKFAKAFKKEMGVLPSSYRKNKK